MPYQACRKVLQRRKLRRLTGSQPFSTTLTRTQTTPKLMRGSMTLQQHMRCVCMCVVCVCVYMCCVYMNHRYCNAAKCSVLHHERWRHPRCCHPNLSTTFPKWDPTKLTPFCTDSKRFWPVTITGYDFNTLLCLVSIYKAFWYGICNIVTRTSVIDLLRLLDCLPGEGGLHGQAPSVDDFSQFQLL